MGLLEIIEQKLKGEAQQMQAEIEKQTVGKKGGSSQLTSKLKRLKGQIKLDQGN